MLMRLRVCIVERRPSRGEWVAALGVPPICHSGAEVAWCVRGSAARARSRWAHAIVQTAGRQAAADEGAREVAGVARRV